MGAHKKYPRSSFFYAMGNCEAAWQLSVTSGEEPPTTFAEKGTRVHAVLAHKRVVTGPTDLFSSDKPTPEPAQTSETFDTEPLDAAEKDLFLDLQTKADVAERRWLGSETSEEILIEERLWLRNGLIPIFSGQPDRIVRAGARALIIDFKTGWHPQDEIAATNSQLRSYVALVKEFWSFITEVTVLIVKPGKMSPPAVFDAPAIEHARNWCVSVATHAVAKGEKTPHKGEWCKFCSGKVLCPLWKNEVLSFSERADLAVTEIPDTVLAELGPRLELAAMVIKKLQDRLWGRVQLAPENFPDWRLVEGDRRRSVEDLWPLYDEAVTHRADLTFQEFMDCCRIAIGEFEATVRRNKKLSLGEIQEYYGQFMTLKPTKSRLVYDPKPKELTNG